MAQQAAPPYAVGQSDARPWGTWTVIDVAPGYVVKRILVRPGQRLSLQRHRHREEHWVVVAGTAEVVLGDQRLRLEVGETTRVPCGEAHRAINPGSVDLVFIEVQVGAALSEDDIERLEDDYGRLAPGAERSGG